tara:strand:- start:58819 stop:60213 length:1395 start_codon:yes stop_codon:yes gene_type:complete
MKKTITVTVHNRKKLLENLLSSLVKNDLDGWDIILSVEPTPLLEDMISSINKILDGLQYKIIVPKEKEGVKNHPFKLLSYVYEVLLSDVNIYLEEDLVVSPDITKIADWYMTLDRDSYKGYAGISLFNYDSFSEYSKKESQEFVVDTYNWSALGFILDKRGWFDQLKFNWYRKDHHLKTKGWDFAIRAHIIWHGMKWLQPEVSRTTHLGTWGTHVNPEVQNHYNFFDIKYLKQDIAESKYFVSDFSTEEFNNMCVVVPYRNREHQVESFVSGISDHMNFYHPDIKYEIQIIEQYDDHEFNRAKLLNIGYDLNKHKNCYFCFHDIDLIPEGRSCDYSFPCTPTHLSAFCSQFNYKLPYAGIFGGVTLFDKFHFNLLNGYSNEYWGWGAEDDDMKKRIDSLGISWKRRDGRFASMHHDKASKKSHSLNVEKLHSRYDFSTDGLKNLNYTLVERIENKSYVINRVKT